MQLFSKLATLFVFTWFGLPCAAAYAAPPSRAVLVLGDSLSAAYGLSREQGWVHLLAEKMALTTTKHHVVNASISGETSSGGAQRLPALLAQHKPALVIIELGGNDALRGLALAQTQRYFEQMVRLSKAAKASVLLIPMQMPPNYGAQYAKSFEDLYPAVAQKYKVALTPFILNGFANQAEFFQRDRIHPTAQAQAMMLATVWPAIKPFLK